MMNDPGGESPGLLELRAGLRHGAFFYPESRNEELTKNLQIVDSKNNQRFI
jgi:hypothetical protein